MSARRPPPSCAICGTDIPPRARACPHCGADERNGWDGQDIYDGLDLPDDPDDEDRAPAGARGRADGRGRAAKPSHAWFWRGVAVFILLVLVLMALRGL